MNTRTHILHVSGTHCPSCKIFIEDALQEVDGIERVHVDLRKEIVTIDTLSEVDSKELARVCGEKIQKNGYALSVEKDTPGGDDGKSLLLAIPIGLVLLMVFFAVQKSGILNFGLGGDITPVTSFIIGLVASVSSCLAVVGGLVLSLSATVSQDAVRDTKPIALFHAGRIVSFAFLGGVLGAFGGVVGISFTATALLGVLASVVMIMLGLQLVGAFKNAMVAIPPNVFNFFRRVEHKTFAPFLIGVGTFFLPCGFTQAMQVAALSSGSFASGFLIMSAFALGTFPMLAFLSFGSASFAQSSHAPLFFKSAGVVVIGLGMFSLLAGLAGLGVINPLFSI